MYTRGILLILLVTICAGEALGSSERKTATASNQSQLQNPEGSRRKCSPVITVSLMFLTILPVLFYTATQVTQEKNSVVSPSSSPLQAEQCTPSLQTCLAKNQSLPENACLDVLIKNADNTTTTHPCLCPLTPTQKTQLAAANKSNYCVKPNMNPCSQSNGCRDNKRLLEQIMFANISQQTTSYKRNPKLTANNTAKKRSKGRRKNHHLMQ